MRNTLKHINACIILHNFLNIHCLSNNEEFIDYDRYEFSDIDADNELNTPIKDGLAKDERRTQVKNYVLENYC